MAEIQLLPEMLRCPSCGGEWIARSAERIDCSACGAVHPVFDGIPWVYRDVASSRSQWASKLQHLKTEVTDRLAALDQALDHGGLMSTTQRRLARQRAAWERLGTQIFALLAPFAFARSEILNELPKHRIPSRQHFSSYLETVFRDWSWGEPELQATLDSMAPLLSRARKDRHVLVLGGGAGRLSYELACQADTRSVVQLDINPLLTRIGSLIARGGETVPLTEVPRLPLGLDHVAVDQVLARPGAPPRAPLYFLLGDVFTPPFAPGSFDLIVTPWFVDILPESFDRVARRLNGLLAPGGHWISFGPLSFESMPPSGRFTREEMEEALEAAGMDLQSSELHRVAYLHSPHSMVRRNEEILVFDARLREHVAIDRDFAFYPSWMTNPEESVPALPIFESMRNDRIFDLEILGCIDGRASIRDIVSQLSTKYSLPSERCESAVNRFFARLIEQESEPGGETPRG